MAFGPKERPITVIKENTPISFERLLLCIVSVNESDVSKVKAVFL
jgi:hypothetical protein